MKYFENVKSLEELKKVYRRLAMKHHPDVGGDTAIMQEINAEHDTLFEILKKAHNAKADEDKSGKTKKTTETPEEFRDIVSVLLKLDGIECELCGSWIWVGGDTRPHKDALKAAGCRWSHNKKKWYWRHEEDGGKRWHSKKHYTMDEIRAVHGSEWLAMSNRAAINA